jgi:hypothetical protein
MFGFFVNNPDNVLGCSMLDAGVRVSYRLGNNLFVLGNVSGMVDETATGAGLVAFGNGWLSANLRFSQLITAMERQAYQLQNKFSKTPRDGYLTRGMTK